MRKPRTRLHTRAAAAVERYHAATGANEKLSATKSVAHYASLLLVENAEVRGELVSEVASLRHVNATLLQALAKARGDRKTLERDIVARLRV